MEVKLGQVKSSWERPSHVRTGQFCQVILDQVKLRQEKSGQVETGQVKLGKVKSDRSSRKFF